MAGTIPPAAAYLVYYESLAPDRRAPAASRPSIPEDGAPSCCDTVGVAPGSARVRS